MKRTMRWVGVGLLFSLGLGVPGMQAQQPVSTEPQAPSRTVQTPQEVVPALPVPRLVKFAGVLQDEQGKARTGVVGVTFAIYKEQEGGAALWLETQNLELDEQGRYTVLLGTTKNEGLALELFTAGEPRWLGVQVNLAKEVEQPRVLLVSVPYALKAADAETLGGKPLSSFVLAPPPSGGVVGVGTTLNPAGTAPIGAATIGGGGTQNFVAKFDATGANVVNSSLFDNGLVGIGTTNPQASLDVQLTTGSPTNALNSTITLNNSSPITGSVLSAFKMTLNYVSTAANLSKQPARFVYLRDASATGGVTAFDWVMSATSFLSGDAPYPLRGVNIEGPTIVPGNTLFNFTGLYIGSPGGAGAVTNKFALITEPNAGNVGIGTTTPASQLHVQNGASAFTSDIFSVDGLAGECNSNGCAAVDAITSASNGVGVFAEAQGSGAIAVQATTDVGNSVLAAVTGACTGSTSACNLFVGHGNLGSNVTRIDNVGKGFFN